MVSFRRSSSTPRSLLVPKAAKSKAYEKSIDTERERLNKSINLTRTHREQNPNLEELPSLDLGQKAIAVYQGHKQRGYKYGVSY